MDTVAGGEQRDELAEGAPRLGETVDRQNRAAFGTSRHVVQLGPVELGVMVGDSGQ